MDGGYVTSHLVMHFTHVKNLSGVLATGCLQADSLVDRSSALQVEAADPAVKSRRKVRRVRRGDPGAGTPGWYDENV
jgi:hypothetical protein